MADYKNEFGWFAERPQVPKKIFNMYTIFIGLAALRHPGHLPPVAQRRAGRPAPDPNLDTPAIKALADKDRQCVLPTEEMRANHMQLWLIGGNRWSARATGYGSAPAAKSLSPASPTPAWDAIPTRRNSATSATTT
jgi:hypothetical protein